MSAGELNSAPSAIGFLEIRVIKVKGIMFNSYCGKGIISAPKR